MTLDLSPAVAPERTSAPGTPLRDPFFDNAKFMLIVLVVVGHAITTLVDGADGLRAMYYWIYSFHMPAFILIAGYFTQRVTYDEKRVRRLVGTTLVPYVIFTVLYAVMRWGYGEGFTVDLFTPYWLLWFLPALFVWRVSAPVVERLRWPVLTTLAVAIAAGSWASLDRGLALDRALSLLPFFALGLSLRREFFAALRKTPLRVAAVVILVAGAFGAVLAVQSSVTSGWLYWNEDFTDLDVGLAAGMLGRLTMFVIALAMAVSFLAVVPQRRTWFTWLGQASLTVYLLHGFAVLAFRLSPLDNQIDSLPGYALVLAAAVALAVVLSTPFVRTLARPAVEPRVTWLFRPDPYKRRNPNARSRSGRR